MPRTERPALRLSDRGGATGRMPRLSGHPILTLFLVLLAAHVLARAEASEWAPTEVASSVYALIGPTCARTAENDALNCNIGFAVTKQGVVLIDSGASRIGAERIARAVGSVTDQPIRWVINTGSQDHRWLGNGYFAERDAEIIALRRTAETQERYATQHLASLKAVLGERLAGTEPLTAPAPLAGDEAHLTVGGVRLELRYLGDAHFPGDVVVWLPDRQVLFSGDLVYTDRLLGVLPSSHVLSWQAAFHRLEDLKPAVIVPGHGRVSDLAKAQGDTGDYLDWLVANVGAAQAQWEPLDEVVERLADAPRFSHLENFETLHRPNINRAYLDFERGAD